MTETKDKASRLDRRASLVGAFLPPNEKSKPRIDFDLSEREYAFIGLAAVHWSFLEHCLLTATKGIAEERGITQPRIPTPNAFNDRLKDFRVVVEQIPDEAEKNIYLDIYNKISTENGFRQKLIHGIWAYDRINPEKLHVEISRDSDVPPRDHFSEDRIRDFALRVAELSFQLIFPMGYTLERLAAVKGDACFKRSFFLGSEYTFSTDGAFSANAL